MKAPMHAPNDRGTSEENDYNEPERLENTNMLNVNFQTIPLGSLMSMLWNYVPGSIYNSLWPEEPCPNAKLSIVICGKPGSGKTSYLNLLFKIMRNVLHNVHPIGCQSGDGVRPCNRKPNVLPMNVFGNLIYIDDKGAPELVDKASKLLDGTFFRRALANHALPTGVAHCVIVVIRANEATNSISMGVYREFIEKLKDEDVPFIVVITMVDLLKKEDVDSTIKNIVKSIEPNRGDVFTLGNNVDPEGRPDETLQRQALRIHHAAICRAENVVHRTPESVRSLLSIHTALDFYAEHRRVLSVGGIIVIVILLITLFGVPLWWFIIAILCILAIGGR